MNKNAIQRFAIWARTELIAQVSQRAYQYDVTEEGYGKYDAEAVGGRLLSDDEKRQRRGLIDQIRHKGYAQVMEEVAYTWFNRFIALRFMEVNNYLPTHIRVFSDASGAFKPEILSNALHLDLDGLDTEKVSDLIEHNRTEDLYRYLLLAQCNALSIALPRMFENMGSYTEMLLPNNILRQDGVLGRMVTDIPEEDWTDQVQIIGWLYQYYNTELKDDTFALLKKNVKITKERIPSATQLFTPDWIVRYMVENSLGRIFIDRRKNEGVFADGRDWSEMTWEEIENKRIFNEKYIAGEMGWRYYLPEAEQSPEVREQLDNIQLQNADWNIKDIKILDPCMGSGHILVYAFDVLMQLYEFYGYSQRDAAQSILENNLYGLDIDDRAAQLAYFAVMMKARQYDRRIFTRRIQPHVYAIVESNDIRIPAKWRLGPEQGIAEKLVAELKDAKEYGSIINLSLTLDELAALRKRLLEIDDMSCEGNLTDMLESTEIFNGLFPLVEIAELLVQKYDVVVTNPPYMAVSNASNKMQDYVKKNFPDSKSDLFAVFIERCRMLTKSNGYQAMITQHAWMFLSSFEKLRIKLQTVDTVNMAHLGARAFEEIGGEVVQTTSFVFRQSHIEKYTGTYCRLIDSTSQSEKEALYLSGKSRFFARQSNFPKIPGSPIAYWVSEALYNAFTNPTLGSMADARIGMVSGDNNRFLRLWFEIDIAKSSIGQIDLSKKWFPLQKGGGKRYWYGNLEYVINWENDGDEIRNKNVFDGRIRSHNYNGDKIFLPGITWNSIGTADIVCRVADSGFIFDAGGPLCTINNSKDTLYCLGLLTSTVAQKIFAFINPTINFTPGTLLSLPVIISKEHYKEINDLVNECISISKRDWNDFDTAWDFEIHPIVKKALSRSHWGHDDAITIDYVYKYVAQEFNERFSRLKANEEKLNRIFIGIYGLQDELTSEVEDKDVTVRRANLGRDIRSLISYAVGCMFGRYSLDVPGLAYAGGEWDGGKYKTFLPDKDNVIPICDDEYFGDDIVGRFINFLEVVFGKETLEENLKFIADALGGKGSPREVIRSYFLNDFYADHLKTYQKRPIYWLFDSGKKNGFKALIYMHRYQSDLLARLRTDYVHEQQERYRTQLKHIADAMDSASASERIKLSKQQKKLQEQALELQKYEEKIHHLADQNIKIDLDDGVKHNYELFADVLAKIR